MRTIIVLSIAFLIVLISQPLNGQLLDHPSQQQKKNSNNFAKYILVAWIIYLCCWFWLRFLFVFFLPHSIHRIVKHNIKSLTIKKINFISIDLKLFVGNSKILSFYVKKEKRMERKKSTDEQFPWKFKTFLMTTTQYSWNTIMKMMLKIVVNISFEIHRILNGIFFFGMT